jgi:acetyltransferase-like isoleucine patch superfamily enzyme
VWIYNNTIAGNHIKKTSHNEIIVKTAKLKKIKIIIKGKNNKVFFDNYSRLSNCIITISGNNNIIYISERTNINNTRFHLEDDFNEVKIGYHTSIYGKTYFHVIEGTKVIIGEDCMFANDIHFRTGDAHSIIDIHKNRINYSEDIILGNHVWIGERVMCLKGVNVPDNCVIGAGALLINKYEYENSIYAGVPAKLVKTDIDWLRERIL